MQPAAADHAAARPRPACRASCSGVEPGEEIELSREHVVTVVRHDAHDPVAAATSSGSGGNKLKEEYHGLPGDQIRDLRLSRRRR